MKTSLIALAAAVAVAMAPFDTADAARPQAKKTPPSSYAPSTAKSGKRTYGAPIQAPIVGQAATRTEQARAEFRKQEPCPSTGLRSGKCPGYRIGYIRPLSRGGQNLASNMKWEPLEVTASGR